MSRGFRVQTVVVTGAGSEIGYEMSRLFLDARATIVAGDVRPEDVPIRSRGGVLRRQVPALEKHQRETERSHGN